MSLTSGGRQQQQQDRRVNSQLRHVEACRVVIYYIHTTRYTLIEFQVLFAIYHKMNLKMVGQLVQNLTRVKVIWQKATSIGRLIMSYAEEILSISSIIFVRWQHASRSWSWFVHLGLLFWGRGVVEGQRLHHSKKQCWFPKRSPLWPLRYL